MIPNANPLLLEYYYKIEENSISFDEAYDEIKKKYKDIVKDSKVRDLKRGVEDLIVLGTERLSKIVIKLAEKLFDFKPDLVLLPMNGAYIVYALIRHAIFMERGSEIFFSIPFILPVPLSTRVGSSEESLRLMKDLQNDYQDYFDKDYKEANVLSGFYERLIKNYKKPMFSNINKVALVDEVNTCVCWTVIFSPKDKTVIKEDNQISTMGFYDMLKDFFENKDPELLLIGLTSHDYNKVRKVRLEELRKNLEEYHDKVKIEIIDTGKLPSKIAFVDNEKYIGLSKELKKGKTVYKKTDEVAPNELLFQLYYAIEKNLIANNKHKDFKNNEFRLWFKSYLTDMHSLFFEGKISFKFCMNFIGKRYLEDFLRKLGS